MPKCAFGQSQVGSTLWPIRMPSDATVLPSASGVLFMANASISGEDGVISVTIHLTERINLIRSQALQSMDWFILVYIGLYKGTLAGSHVFSHQTWGLQLLMFPPIRMDIDHLSRGCYFHSKQFRGCWSQPISSLIFPASLRHQS